MPNDRNYRYAPYNRTGWDNLADFLSGFTPSLLQNLQLKEERDKEKTRKKMEFQSQDPELQESLRVRMTPKEQEAVGLATKDSGKWWNPRDTTYNPVPVRGLTTTEKRTRELLGLQTKTAEVGLESAVLGVEGQRDDNQLKKLMVQLTQAKQPLEQARIAAQIDAIKKGQAQNATFADKVNAQVMGHGLSPEAAKTMVYATTYPTLFEEGTLYDINPLDDRKVGEKVAAILPTYLAMFPTSPQTGMRAAQLAAVGDKEGLDKLIKDPNIRTQAQIQLSMDQQRIDLQRRSLEQSAQETIIRVQQTLTERYPNLNTYEANSLAKSIWKGETPTGAPAEAIALGRQTLTDAMKREAQLKAGQIKNLQFDNLAKAVTNLTSKATVETLNDQQKAEVTALTNKMIEVLADEFGVVKPTPGTGQWQMFMQIISGATAIGQMGVTAANIADSPQGKATAAFIGELRKTTPGTLADPGVQWQTGMIGGPPGSAAAGTDIWSTLEKSQSQVSKELQDQMVATAHSNPAFAAGTRAYYEDLGRNTIALAEAATTPEDKEKYKAMVKEISDFVARLPKGAK